MFTAIGGGSTNSGVPGGLGGYGEREGLIDYQGAADPVRYYQTKISGYDENYGRGGSGRTGSGRPNTGQGGGTITGSNGGSGVCIIKYWSVY
jgi:hypothetical protein